MVPELAASDVYVAFPAEDGSSKAFVAGTAWTTVSFVFDSLWLPSSGTDFPPGGVILLNASITGSGIDKFGI